MKSLCIFWDNFVEKLHLVTRKSESGFFPHLLLELLVWVLHLGVTVDLLVQLGQIPHQLEKWPATTVQYSTVQYKTVWSPTPS